jgi:hypothetical protein
VADPLAVTRTPWTYRDYVARSKAEFSVAKHGYVATECGWFSERSAAYLASGRPVIVQDTGFTRWLAASPGVLPFRTPDEAAACVVELAGDYAWHCRGARDVVAANFDARVVLTSLIERAMSDVVAAAAGSAASRRDSPTPRLSPT